MPDGDERASAPRERATCPACGDRLGYYEPLRCRLTDGTVAEGGLLTLADVAPGVALFHAGCFVTVAGERAVEVVSARGFAPSPRT